jgi:transforming growth factor-beta-induced protein
MRRHLVLTSLLATLVMGAFAQDPPPPPEKKDIYDTLQANEQAKTAYQYLEAAELKDTLKGKGKKELGYTVFVPTEQAFAKLPKPITDKLLADKKLLQQVLLYHVVEGKSKAADLPVGKTLKTAQGETIALKLEEGNTFINGAKLVAPDTEASNGQIHFIDVVLIPPSVAQKLGIVGT